MSGRTNVRRTKPSAATRLRPYRILIALGIAALAAFAVFVVTWPGFAPKTVTVTGNRVVARDEIVARAGILPHVNLWLQDPKTIAHRIESIPYVGTAAVHRRPPSTIAIDVVERIPFAVASSGAEGVFIDRDLRVLGPAPPQSGVPRFALPPKTALQPGTFLSGDAVRLRDAYAALVAAHVFPVALGFDRFGGLTARLRDGVTILFGDESEIDKKFALVGPILAQAQRNGRRLATVDLRAPNTPVATYK